MSTAVAAPQRSCLTCRRQQYHSAADALRCTEPRSNATAGLIVIGFRKAKKGLHTERVMQHDCALVAERCKFYQVEA